jgi:hypothetical protein
MRIRDPGRRQFGSGIRDGKKSDPGSGINIPDPHHWVEPVFWIDIVLMPIRLSILMQDPGPIPSFIHVGKSVFKL